MVPSYSTMVKRDLCLLFYKVFIWVCVIGEKEAVILNVQPDEPPESPGRTSEHPVGASVIRAFTCASMLLSITCRLSSQLVKGRSPS